MVNVLYTIFIYPVEQIIELAYVLIFRVFMYNAFNHILSILGISFTVSLLTLPLYIIAEKHQCSERDMQKRMKPDVDNIKSVFSGDECFMRLATYYRQNRYHPVYSLRSSVSLIIQIPFFIAAWHFLSSLEALQGVSFGPINDLAKPDSLLKIGNYSINILPVVMTIISCVSAAIYTMGFSAKEKIQLYGMALVFMLLLYNSPSGMVLYWTGNNIFSLVKNIFQKMKIPKFVIVILTAVFCFVLDIYLIFIRTGIKERRYLLALFITLIPVLMFFLFLYTRKNKSPEKVKMQDNSGNNAIFILSLTVLFLIAGLVIPSSLIVSSVQEFSFIENYKSPFPFIANTVLQSFGIFLLWPICIYCMLSQNKKQIFTTVAAILAFIAIINAFLFSGKYGFITLMFTFSENPKSTGTEIFVNLFVIAIVVSFLLLLIYRFHKVMIPALVVTICALIFIGTLNSIKINKEFLSFQLQQSRSNTSNGSPVYQFSKNGKNVLVIMLDRAISGFIPYIFDEKPELYNSFDGFTWYKNTISFGGYTLLGLPGIFGGYEYTPLEMQARDNIPLVEKHNEALLMLPEIFLNQGFKVTVTDPGNANYSWIPDLRIFDKYPEINAENLIGNGYYNWVWLSNNPNILSINTAEMIKKYLIRFSFFKFVPLVLRNFVYDKADWWTLRTINITENTGIPRITLDSYIALDILPDISIIDETEINTYNVLCNDLTHSPAFLQAPDYVPANSPTNTGNSHFTDSDDYHVNIAAFLLLGKWFDYLKNQEVYDNTRIIIVSDHGWNLYGKFTDSIVLPTGQALENYAALLMVKDFNEIGYLVVDDSFMTNADVPLIALNNIVEKPVNPWTGKEITSDKADGITLTTSFTANEFNQRNIFNIRPDEWLHVHSNIFDPENWSKVIYTR